MRDGDDDRDDLCYVLANTATNVQILDRDSYGNNLRTRVRFTSLVGAVTAWSERHGPDADDYDLILQFGDGTTRAFSAELEGARELRAVLELWT